MMNSSRMRRSVEWGKRDWLLLAIIGELWDPGDMVEGDLLMLVVYHGEGI